MDMKNAKLFQPLKVGSLTLHNRVGMAPHEHGLRG